MADKHTPYTLSDWLTYLSHDEIDFLTSMAMSLPEDAKIVNIGAGGGTSGLTFRLARPNGFLYTIDPTYHSNPLGSLESEMGILEANGLLDKDHYRPIHSMSIGAGESWPYGKMDFVFVDGDHSYEGCMGDIKAWLPNIKKGGIIALHDYEKEECYARQHPGVEITQDLRGRVIKAYSGVDSSVHEALIPYYQTLGTVDSLIAFRV